MEGELGAGARIALAFIVIGFVVSLIFMILGFVRTSANQGIAKVQNSMDAMSLAQFDDYDQQIISGTRVTSALKLFEGTPYAMVVRTTAQSAAAAGTGHNYGALLVGTSASTYITSALTKGPGDSFYTRDIAVAANGTMTYNMVTLPTSKSGTVTYIRPTAKFLAELIKDSTGTIVGVSFLQQ